MIGRAVASEMIKLRTLPAAWTTGVTTVGLAAALTAAVATSTVDPSVDAVTIVLGNVAFLQVGPIVLGVVAVASEYAGHELRTTLTAVPDRRVALFGKAVALLLAAAVTSVVALVSAVATGWALGRSDGVGSPWLVAGAAAYLVLVGLLAAAVTVVLRSLVPSLVVMLVGVIVASPLLASVTDLARWLPRWSADSFDGTLVLLAWVLLAGTAAAVGFVRRDA